MSTSPVQTAQDRTPPSPNVEAVIYDSSSNSWQIVGLPILDLLGNKEYATCIIFSSIEYFLDDVTLQKELCKYFPNLPRMFWSKTCVQHNGFFGAKTSANASSTVTNAVPTKVETWFRMIVKFIEATPKDAEFTRYQWYEMSFLTNFSNDRNILLCFDTPRSLAWNLLDMLEEEENKDVATGPYGLHQLLLEQLMVMYDESVWDIARIMRNNEKSKGPMGHTDLHYFIKLYEDSRHTVHSIEATSEATKVVECIAQQCQTLALRPSAHQELLSSRADMLRFHHTMMQGFLARAVSNDRRMGNEQNLTSNLMTQLDAKTNVDIAMATKDDGAAMKTIAVVTMLFLPATFVSAVLGMNFFNFSPDEHGGHMTYSHDLWIYFVISIVLTAVLFVLWWIWQNYRQKVLASSRLEQNNAMENAYAVLQKP
ncbi:hypothetical protein QM012_008050 [Aureobasidium pullulans]|uniref:Mg2+ transporter protein n=1 Tax=Aureobasidium pullulans TaxID=5580 RepID=A0ABR0TMY1_AURPU